MKLLFMCVANSARSQLAEGLAKKIFGPGHEVESAGSNPKYVHPLAIEALKELDIDISKHTSKTIHDLPKEFTDHIDFIFTLCAEEVCPIISSRAQKIHWPIADPANHNSNESQEPQLDSFRLARDLLLEKLLKFKEENKL